MELQYLGQTKLKLNVGKKLLHIDLENFSLGDDLDP